ADPPDRRLYLLCRWTWLLLRRHIARVKLLQHGQPLLAILLVGEVLRQTLDVELPFGLGPRVAFLAVLGEERRGGSDGCFVIGTGYLRTRCEHHQTAES